jgi:hypothetical protein
MNIEREFPLHVAIWNNDTERLAQLIKQNKVSEMDFIRKIDYLGLVFVGSN